MTTKTPIDMKLDPRSKALLKKMAKHAKILSLKNSFRVIGMSYRKEVKGIFERKQVRDPKLRWAPLAPSTQAEKARKGFGNKGILVRTEKLKKSMTSKGAAGNIAYYGHRNAFFGSSVPYGVYHDNLDEQRKVLPLRNFSQPAESTYGSWLNTINSDVTKQLKAQGVSA